MRLVALLLVILAWACNPSNSSQFDFVINDWGAQYDEIRIADEDEQLVYIKKGDKWGLARYDGKVIFPAKYDDIHITVAKYKQSESIINPVIVILTLDGKDALYRVWPSHCDHYHNCDIDEMAPFAYKFQLFTNDSDRLGIIIAQGEDGNFSLFNLKGTGLLPPLYKELMIKDTLLYGYLNQHWEVYNWWGTEFISSEEKPADPNCGIIPFMHNDKWGAFNLKTQDSIPNEYEVFDAYDEYYECARVKKNNKWGYLDTKGEEHISIKYDTLGVFEDFGEEKMIAIARLGKKWGAIDTDGNIAIPFVYEAIAEDIGDYYYRKVKKNNRWGLLTCKGEMALTPKYEDIRKFYYGLYEDDVSESFLVKQKGKWGIARTFTNEVLLTPTYDSIQTIVDYNLLKLWKNGKQGYADAITHQVLINPIYEEAHYFINDYASVKKKGKWGVINQKQQVVIPFEYDSLGHYAHHRFLIAKKGKKGLINNKNDLITPLYDDLKRDFQGFAFAKVADKWQIINETTGKAITELIYDVIEGLDVGLKAIESEYEDTFVYTLSDEIYYQIFKVKKNNLYGWINDQGKELTPIKYDEISRSYGGLSIVKVGNNYGVINIEGKEILPAIYDQIERINDYKIVAAYKYGSINYATREIVFDTPKRVPQKFLAARKKNKWQLIDNKGKAITPLKYDVIQDETMDFYEGTQHLIPIFVGGKWGFVRPDGSEIPPCYDRIIGQDGNFIEVTTNSSKVLEVIYGEFFIDYRGVCQQDCYNAPANHPRREDEK